MKNWHYIAIFIGVVVVIGGLLLFNAATVDDVGTDVVEITSDAPRTGEVDESFQQQEIDVLNDADFEADAFDAEIQEDLSDFDEIDGLVEDMEVTL